MIRLVAHVYGWSPSEIGALTRMELGFWYSAAKNVKDGRF